MAKYSGTYWIKIELFISHVRPVLTDSEFSRIEVVFDFQSHAALHVAASRGSNVRSVHRTWFRIHFEFIPKLVCETFSMSSDVNAYNWTNTNIIFHNYDVFLINVYVFNTWRHTIYECATESLSVYGNIWNGLEYDMVE